MACGEVEVEFSDYRGTMCFINVMMVEVGPIFYTVVCADEHTGDSVTRRFKIEEIKSVCETNVL